MTPPTHPDDPTAQPPQDLAAERSVLGSAMSTGDALLELIDILSPEDFYRPAHQAIYRAQLALFEAGERPDPITVADELERRGELQRAGGHPYLHTLYADALPLNATYHAEIVAEKAVLRRLVEAGTRIVQLGYNGAEGAQVDEVVDRAQAALHHATTNTNDRAVPALDTLVTRFLDELEQPTPPVVPTPWVDLNDVLAGGLHPGQLIVVGARPGIGKSVVGINQASHTARHGDGVLLTSLEMSESEVMQRVYAGLGGIELTALRTRNLSGDDWARITRVTEQIDGWPLVVDARAPQTAASIRKQARATVRELGRQGRELKLIIIDYLQIMSTSGRRPDSRVVEIGDFTRGLKLLGKELGVPVMVLSQVNRGPMQRADKRPTMEDLRESGNIEADADVVILLHREPSAPTDIEVIVAKQRQGPARTITLRWRGHYSRIDDPAERHLEAV